MIYDIIYTYMHMFLGRPVHMSGPRAVGSSETLVRGGYELFNVGLGTKCSSSVRDGRVLHCRAISLAPARYF